MGALDDELREGLALQEAGDWAAALACYTRVVARAPAHSQGLYLAGVAEAHAGRLEAGKNLLQRCLALRPGQAEAVAALGGVLLAQDNPREAVEALERARELGSTSAALCCDLGTAYTRLLEPERAAACYEEAVTLQPDLAEAHFQLGNTRKTQDRLDEAARSYERAVRASAGHAPAWYGLGLIHQLQNRPAEAIHAYKRALAVDPENAEAENNLGLVLRAEGRLAEAIAAFQRARRLRPDKSAASVNLAVALQDDNRAAESIPILESVLARAPGDVRALANLGNAWVALNRPADGILAYERALAVDPTMDEVRYNIGLARLTMGDFECGWAGYEARLATPKHRELFNFPTPRWHADQHLAGRTLLVYAEQGLGDTIQFVRYLSRFASTGARVVVRVQTPLQPLLAAQPGAALVIGSGDPLPPHDFHCPMLSLPREFATRADSIPSQVPYIVASPTKVALWRNVFAQAAGLKVGLVWSGNPRHQFDRNRSVPLAQLTSLAEAVPAHFFALQKDPRDGDLATLAAAPRITDLSERMRDFEDTAAIVTALDLVLTVDTSVAHLAGAVGTATWLMLAYAPDWRWLLDRTDSPWYPSLRLFRQPAPGDWVSVVRDVTAELSALARPKS